ncbi:MAG: S26 family signal peptidase [Candidatus Poseidoniales archaeon]|jgi:nickel-type superoxide dismutase maturation protease
MNSHFLNVVVKGDSMWPTLVGGVTVKFEKLGNKRPEVGQFFLAQHPLKKDTKIIKRIQSMDENNVFLFGDDLNPTASEDSYNFGMA